MVRAFRPEIDSFRRYNQLHVCVALALFIQYLNANIEKFRLFLIIDEISIVKLNGVCPGIARDLLYLQIVLGNGLPVFFLRLRGRNENRQKSK